MKDDGTLRIALVEVDKGWNLLGRIKEAASLCKEKKVDKIFLHMSTYTQPYRLFNASNICLGRGIQLDDLIIDEPNLASFVKEREEGVGSLIVITTWMGFAWAWFRFKKQPGWVWEPIEFHPVSVF